MTTHAMLDIAQHIGAWDPKDPKAYTVQEGALVSDILAGMLGPPCDENRDARHKLQLKIQELHAKDPAKAAMKAEVWMFKGDGTVWVNVAAFAKYLGMDANNHLARNLKKMFDGGNIPHKHLQVPGDRGGVPKHVYLMDTNELYLVAVRLHGWEFMAEASHINAKKAVRGLASDLQDFHAQAQDNSAAQLMQQGAAAGEAAAQITGEVAEMELEERRLELAERRFELKRKADEWEMSMKEWQMTLPCVVEAKKLANAAQFVSLMDALDPDWRQDKRMQLQAKDRLASAHLFEPRLAITQGGDGAPRLESASLTVKEVADSLRSEIHGPIDRSLLQRAGKEVAQLYFEKHGKPPSKHKEMHDGRVIDVNSYTEADRPLLEQAVRRAAAGGGRPVTQFFGRV